MNPKTCRVCLVEHDDEIHAATLSVLDWFHEQVTQSFREEPEFVPAAEQGEAPAAPAAL